MCALTVHTVLYKFVIFTYFWDEICDKILQRYLHIMKIIYNKFYQKIRFKSESKLQIYICIE